MKKSLAKFGLYKASAYPSIYVPSGFNVEIPFDSLSESKKELFSLPTRYINPCEFKYVLPSSKIPEFAFIGRSNVGKSSLVDTLLGNKKIVRISKEPGCTQSVNYYSFEKKSISSLYFVDLPGYGFAKISKSERERWTDMINGYLFQRDQTVLRRVFLLVDGRRGPGTHDEEMMKMLDASMIPYQIVVTKQDVSSPKELDSTLNSIFAGTVHRKKSSCFPVVYVVSSKSGYGIEALTLGITEMFLQKWPPLN